MKTAVVPGKKGKMPKRRTFRPISRPKNTPPEKKATAISTAASREEPATTTPSLPPVTLPEKDDDEFSAPETQDLSTALVEHTAIAEEETILESDKKRAASHLPLVLVPPIIPEDTSGKPTLKSLCEFPRRKRTKKAADATTQPSEAVVAAQKEIDASMEVAVPAGPAVQIINGELVLQESSMIVQNTTGNKPQSTAMTVVEEEAELAIVNASYTSFATGRRARMQTAQWHPDETHLFFEALRQVGLDFTSMESYFAVSNNPHVKKRDRRQLKRKYQRESAKNPKLVERALMPSKRVEIDLSVFELTKQAVLDYKRSDDEQEDTTTTLEPQNETEKTTPTNLNASTAAPLGETEESVAEDKDTAEMQDPLLLEDQEEATEEATTLRLVTKKPTNKPTTRPKFRKPRKAKKSPVALVQ